jgi:HAD superfamily hydrolase (TIGR01509 family)
MSLSPLAALLSRKRLLVFDFDGTIVDSSPLHARAFSEAFAPEGVEVDYSTIAGMTTGAAVDRLAAGAGLALSPEKREALIADKRERALRLVESELKAIEGAVEFVRAARARWPLALCTSGSRRTIDVALDRVGLTNAFDPLVTAESVSNSKPHPEGFLMAAAAHSVAPGDALVFEDAETGLAAARSAGIDVIHVVPAAERPGPAQADWTALNAALAELAP